jgi:NADH:ubiquinone oxidoreductase subunit 2 (subunit N)
MAVCIALLGSAISIMYYFKAFKPMFESAEENTNEAHGSKIHFVVYLMVAVSIVFGMFPYLFERCF